MQPVPWWLVVLLDIIFFYICNNTREYNVYHTITDNTLVRLLTAQVLFT